MLSPHILLSMRSTEMRAELWFGWIILVFVVLAILGGLGALILNRVWVISPKWLKILYPSVGVLGLGIAAYIAYVQLFQAQAICGPLENCNTVLQSRYAKLLGFIPNSVLGTISYLTLFFLWVWHRQRRDWLSFQAPLLTLAITLLGSLLSVYLTVLQVVVLKALCLWCLSSAVLITLLFLLSLSLYAESHSELSA